MLLLIATMVLAHLFPLVPIVSNLLNICSFGGCLLALPGHKVIKRGLLLVDFEAILL